MKIEHIGIWVEDIEKMRRFYQEYFGMVFGEKYINPQKKFESYFLSFHGGEARIELMRRPDISGSCGERGFLKGLAHLAIALGCAEAVDQLTERLRQDGYSVASEPRTTGDGYYESAVLDPEGNYLELFF